jgi:formamidopyrimidine-DNA glycosylase
MLPAAWRPERPGREFAVLREPSLAYKQRQEAPRREVGKAAMPELPEVETTMRALAARLQGRRITALAQRRPDLRFPLPPDLPQRLAGRRIDGFSRRAKYILAALDDGTTILLHLGMSGRLLFDGPPAAAHEHLTFSFDDGTVLRFVDPRRFGMLDLVPGAELERHPRLAGLGLEPLAPGFDGPALGAALAGRTSALKIALMDQRIVVGVGNIYACESLFRAGLSPRRQAGWLRPAQAARLATAIQAVLLEAIEAGGSSLRDYVQANGELGFYQARFAVYGRSDQPCLTCGQPVRRWVQASRATFVCTRCQR